MSCQKKGYATLAEAEAVLVRAVARYKRTGDSGKSWKRLNAFKCPHCPLYHLGRANQLPGAKPLPKAEAAAASKHRSFGEIRRTLAKLEKKWDRERRYRAEQIAKIVEADKALWATEEEMRQQQAQILRELGINDVYLS